MEIKHTESNPMPLRQEMEINIRAFNKHLKPVVRYMTWEELLANCHPIERRKFAWRLWKRKEIDWDTLVLYAPGKRN